MSLPAADDLFRPTDPSAEELASEAHVRVVPDAAVTVTAPDVEPDARRRPSGRVKHDEKMTVYVTADELVDIEHARLTLRRDHGLAVDRGRLVREALALVLADLEENSLDSMLVQRLTER
ncbi:MAG: hypothetical protein ABIO16_01770 [Nocardioides sp.]